jgi:hypothetical protein
MKPNPSGNPSGTIVRTLGVTLIGLATTSSPTAVLGGLVLITAALTVAIAVFLHRFAGMTRLQRLDLIELVRALRQNRK